MLFGIGLLHGVVGLKTLESPGIAFPLSPVCARQDHANLRGRMRVKVLEQFQIRQHLCPSQ